MLVRRLDAALDVALDEALDAALDEALDEALAGILGGALDEDCDPTFKPPSGILMLVRGLLTGLGASDEVAVEADEEEGGLIGPALFAPFVAAPPLPPLPIPGIINAQYGTPGQVDGAAGAANISLPSGRKPAALRMFSWAWMPALAVDWVSFVYCAYSASDCSWIAAAAFSVAVCSSTSWLVSLAGAVARG
jgi:hypothetical protein